MEATREKISKLEEDNEQFKAQLKKCVAESLILFFSFSVTGTKLSLAHFLKIYCSIHMALFLRLPTFVIIKLLLLLLLSYYYYLNYGLQLRLYRILRILKNYLHLYIFSSACSSRGIL